MQIKGYLEGGATKGQKLDSCCLCGRVSSAVGARSAGEAQLLRGGSDRLLRPGTQDLAPAGLARLCGGLHLHHPADRRKRRGRRTFAAGRDWISSVSVALAEFLQRGRLLLGDDDAED